MSLHGVVFKNVTKLEERYGNGLFFVDEDGQACPLSDPVYPQDWEAEFETALSVQIGNIARLSHYRLVLSMVQPDGMIMRILTRRIFRTKISEFDILEADLNELENSPELAELVADIRLLMQASVHEGNPIVWV